MCCLVTAARACLIVLAAFTLRRAPRLEALSGRDERKRIWPFVCVAGLLKKDPLRLMYVLHYVLGTEVRAL